MNCRQPYIAVQYFFVLFVDVQSSWATNSPQPLPPGGCRGLSRHLDLSLFWKRSSLQTATSPDTLSRSFSFLLPFPLTFLFSIWVFLFLFSSFTFLFSTCIKPPSPDLHITWYFFTLFLLSFSLLLLYLSFSLFFLVHFSPSNTYQASTPPYHLFLEVELILHIVFLC